MENKIKKTSREFIGLAARPSRNKTVMVEIILRKTHPKYKKSYQTSRLYPVHDEKSVVKEGDRVLFIECRPLSKTKRWRLVKILENAK